MLRYIYGRDLHTHSRLAKSMFRDRADQFKTRLGWSVQVDAQGLERDTYDALNPLYVIWQRPDGLHGGSMRFLPTTGPVMVNDVFGHLTDAAPICSPLVWECTRFCLARGSGPNVAAALMLGGGQIMSGFGIRQFVGVFDARMVRIYRAIGSSPEVLGSDGEGRDKLSVGLWEFSDDAKAMVAERAGISAALSQLWFERTFGSSRKSEPALTA